MRIKDYPETEQLLANDKLLVDGDDGTRSIPANKIALEENVNKGCLVGRNSATSSSNPLWYKVASTIVKNNYFDHNISFLVNNAAFPQYSNCGILTIDIRVTELPKIENVKIKWLVCSGINKSDFILAYRINGNAIEVELWTKISIAYMTLSFSVLAENYATSINSNIWQLYNTNGNGTGETSIPDDFTKIESSLLTIQNTNDIITDTVVNGISWDSVGPNQFDSVFGSGWQTRIGTYTCRANTADDKSNFVSNAGYANTYSIMFRVWVTNVPVIEITDDGKDKTSYRATPSAFSNSNKYNISNEFRPSDIGSGFVLSVANGGTGNKTAEAAANAFINALSTGSDTPIDADYFISQYAGGGTDKTTYRRRPFSALWDWIRTKTDLLYLKKDEIKPTGMQNVLKYGTATLKGNNVENDLITDYRSNFGDGYLMGDSSKWSNGVDTITETGWYRIASSIYVTGGVTSGMGVTVKICKDNIAQCQTAAHLTKNNETLSTPPIFIQIEKGERVRFVVSTDKTSNDVVLGTGHTWISIEKIS